MWETLEVMVCVLSVFICTYRLCWCQSIVRQTDVLDTFQSSYYGSTIKESLSQTLCY